EARVVCREKAVLCGQPWFDEVFRQLDGGVKVVWSAQEGDDIVPDQVVCRLFGSARSLLTGERTALNFLQTLSGTATIARQYAELVKGTEIRILGARKSFPGLRRAQEYATVV